MKRILKLSLLLVITPSFGQFESADNSQDGWKNSNWFGWYYSETEESKWYYHLHHEWIYVNSGVDYLTFYDPKIGTLYTNETLYPYLYSYSWESWLLYSVGSNFPRWFFDYSTVEWETIYPVFVRDLEELDEAPKVLEQASPVYPEEMRRKEIDGDVLVELIISTSGEVDQAIILESNHPDFSLSAKAAVLKWKFLPGKIANMPVYVRARIPIIFRFSR